MCIAGEANPLIKIGADIRYAKKMAEKRLLLEDRLPSDTFILAWAGKYSTDVFVLSENDIKQVLSPYSND
jgi:hypothetical protein